MRSLRSSILSTAAAFAIMAFSVASARAATVELEFDLNVLTTNSTVNPFTGNGTGTLNFGGNPNSTLSVSINNLNPTSYTSVFSSLSGSLNYTNRIVTGGSLNFSLTNGDAYSFSLQSSAAALNFDINGGSHGQPFTITANTTNGTFTDPQADNKFGTTDVTPWLSTPNGRFIQLNYFPDNNIADMDIDIPSSVSAGPSAVPVPPALWTALPVLGALALIAKRKSKPAA